MANSVTFNPQLVMGLRHILDVEGANNATLTYKEYDRTSPKYDGSSTPAVSLVAADAMSLTGGTDTINLAAAPDALGGTSVDFTGFKVVGLIFNNSANSNSVTIAKGATNGYELQSTHSIVLGAGAVMAFDFDDSLSDVAAGARTLDVTGTASDVLSYVIVGG